MPMNVIGSFVSFPVTDLERACAWYEKVFDLHGAALQAIEGIAQYLIGQTWLQLKVGRVTGCEHYIRFGVEDLEGERQKQVAKGIDAGEIIQIPDAVAYFDLQDPDGNIIGFYTIIL